MNHHSGPSEIIANLTVTNALLWPQFMRKNMEKGGSFAIVLSLSRKVEQHVTEQVMPSNCKNAVIICIFGIEVIQN